jgi:hypothetical protein
MRNKGLGWLSLLVTVLNWLSETPSQASSNSTPAYLSFAMALLAVGTVRTLSSTFGTNDLTPIKDISSSLFASTTERTIGSWDRDGGTCCCSLARGGTLTQFEVVRIIAEQSKSRASF